MTRTLSRTWIMAGFFGILVGGALCSATAQVTVPGSSSDLIDPVRRGATAPPIIPPEELLNPTRRGMRFLIFDLHARIAALGSYDDNIYIRPGHPTDDVIWSIRPGLTAIAGGGLDEKTLTLSYNPSFNFFTTESQNNSIDHAADVAALWPMAKLTLGLRETFQSTSGSVIDVGDRVNRTTYLTALTAKYQFSEKTSFEINGHQLIQNYARLISSTEWVNEDWINYQWSPKLQVSFGPTLGYREIQKEPSQTYEQALLRAIYLLSGKLSFSASAGVEFRQYGADVKDQLGVVFSLAGTYLPWEGAALTIEGHRRNENSALLPGQNYTTTGAGLSVRHRLLGHFWGEAAAAFDLADYQATTTSVVATRSDTYYTMRLALNYRFGDFWEAGFFYQYRRNDSTANFRFDNNIIGLQSSYSF